MTIAHRALARMEFGKHHLVQKKAESLFPMIRLSTTYLPYSHFSQLNKTMAGAHPWDNPANSGTTCLAPRKSFTADVFTGGIFFDAIAIAIG